MFRRVAAVPGVIFTLVILAALWAPLIELHGRALWALHTRPHDFGDLWTTFAPHLWSRSGVLALTTCVFALILGVPTGWLLARGPKRLRGAARVVCAIPLGLPPVIVAAPLFSLAGAGGNPLWPTAWVLALSFFPVVALALAATIESLAPEEEEAALAFASPFRAWAGVLGRRVFPVVLGASGVVAALTLWEMGAPALLSYSTLSSEVYRQLDSATGDAALPDLRAALAGLPIPLFGLLFLVPVARAQIWSGQTQNSAGFARLKPLAWLGILVLLVAPIGVLVRFVWALDGPQAFWLALEGNSIEVWNTVGISTLASLGFVGVGLGLCLTWRNWPRRAAWLVWGAGVLAGLFAPVVVGVALIEWFNRDSGPFWLREACAGVYDSTYGMALWGQFARFFPVALALLFPAVLALDADALWAARGLGASPFHAARTIAWPMLRGVGLGTFALLWALCASELSTQVLVHGPGSDTLPIPIFSLLHAGIAADVAALCLVLAALCGSAMAVASWFLRRR